MRVACACLSVMLTALPHSSAAAGDRDGDPAGTAAAEAVGENDDSSPPKVKKQTRPKYPRGALQQKLEGEVLVEFLIDSNGRVVKTRVLKSVPGLDEAAVACVLEWRFKPATKHGKPVPTTVQVPVRFRIY